MDLSHRPAKLCILSKWTPQYEGYGFDLMTKKSGEGHYISMVHEGGPAEATHLEAGDWLIEVNGVNVEKLSHGEVIKLIKESDNGTVQLLLAPNETDKWRKRNQVTITSSHPDLVHYITPPYQGKLRSFLNGAIDRLVIGKRGEQSDDEPSVYHRYSLPIPSGMSDNVVDWSPSGQSPNGRAEAITMRRSAHGDGQFVGSLDEQRQKEIADWRDKSLEILMASQIDQDEDDIDDHDIINQVQDEVSILSPDVDDDDHIIYIDVQRGNNSRPISSNQEKVLADIHLIDNNSQQDNNSVITNNNNSDTNSGSQDDNRHSTSLTLLDGEFFARQCKVRKDSETADYGFKMDSFPSGGGHFLRSIEPTGPASISGICQNDRLIEVNNVNVEYTDHDTVVNMIRKSPDCEVTLLVVDEKSYKWFQSRNIRIHHGAGGSLVRYCDHRGLREPGYTLDRPVSIGEDNRRSQLYRRGLSQQSAGNSSDGDVEIKDQRDKLSKQLGPEENINREEDNEDDKEDVRKSTSTSGTATTTRSSKLNQRESRSTLSDWSFGSLSEADRFNRGKTIVRVPDDAPRPRLCSISKDPDGVFGFTLNTYEKGRVKLVADIDPGSPAEAAGLLQWDRVIEVNGVNINIENHAQVTGRIKASGNRLHLLVLPEGQYEWYEKAGIVPKSNQSNVIYLSNTDVTRDSITIARSLENSITNLSTSHNQTKPNLPKKPSFSSSATIMSNQLTLSMTSSTSETTLNNISKSSSRLTDDKDEHGGEEQAIVLKNDNQIKELNDQQIDDQSKRNSTISHMIQYNTIDEETTEAIYDHIETRQLSTLPYRKSKKTSFTKIFRRSLFGGKKDKIYSTIGSMSNLSIKSDIVMGQSSSRQQFNHTEAKITRSATLASEDDIPALPEDDENQVQLVVKKGLQEKSSDWSTSSDNIHNNNNNIITMHNNNGITGDQGAMTKDGQKDESESQLLEKLKTLSLRDIKQKSRAESKIQAYHRMQQLNFRQRIAHFEDL